MKMVMEVFPAAPAFVFGLILEIQKVEKMVRVVTGDILIMRAAAVAAAI